jgi:hypothetical protein
MSIENDRQSFKQAKLVSNEQETRTVVLRARKKLISRISTAAWLPLQATPATARGTDPVFHRIREVNFLRALKEPHP